MQEQAMLDHECIVRNQRFVLEQASSHVLMTDWKVSSVVVETLVAMQVHD